MFSRQPFLYKNEIRWMIALHDLQTLRSNLQHMFSGDRCYKNGCCAHVIEIIQKIYL